MAVITPLLNGFFRCPISHLVDEGDGETVPAGKKWPHVSIILSIEGDSYALQRNLPAYLQQEYPGEYDVIVVTRKGDSEVEDALIPFENNPMVYCTYVPNSARYMSKPKLAVTLGGKASKSEWLVMADITSTPISNQWITTLMSNADDNVDMILGYCQYEKEMSSFRRFVKLHTCSYLFNECVKGTPYRATGHNIAFRRKMFMEQDGYRGNLKYTGGEYDFLVNKFASRDNSVLCLNPQSWLLAEQPTEKSWRNGQLFYQENRKHLSRSFWHRLPYVTDQTVLHLNYLAEIGIGIYAAVTSKWILLAISVLALILTVILRTVIGRKFLKIMHEDFKVWTIVPFEIGVIWFDFYYRMKYIHSDKYDFISHKI